MAPLWKNRLIAGCAAIIAVIVGWQVAGGSSILGLLLIALMGLIAIERFSLARPEALLLGLVLAGYIIGNRGFAQLAPVASLPIFPGEFALACGGALMLVRGAIERRLPWRADLLNAVVVLWLAVGLLRIVPDVRDHGMNAVRDFATIYYAGFFFLTQELARHPPSRRWIERCLLVSLALLPLVVGLFNRFPDFFLNRLLIRGAPLIFQKSDLAAAFLFAGAFVFASRKMEREGRWLWVPVAASLLTGIAALSRAGMVGLVVVTGFWAAARRWWLIGVFAVAGVLGVMFDLGWTLVQGGRAVDTRAYGFYEHVLSLGDPAGQRTYRNAESADSGDNNQFRLIWWRTVVEETWHGGPWLGLGFGHDLAARFVQVYYANMADDFTARSPHSIALTMFGRLGLVGFVTWLALMGVLLMRLGQAASRVLQAPTSEEARALGWWSGAMVLAVSACFGVVLEGPMGAALFWALLGLANSPADQEHVGAPGDQRPAVTDELTKIAPMPLQTACSWNIKTAE